MGLESDSRQNRGIELSETRHGGHLLIQVRGTGFRVGDFTVLAAAVNKASKEPLESLAFEFQACPSLDSGSIGHIAMAVRFMIQRGKPVFCIVDHEGIWDSLQTVGLETLIRRVSRVSDYWRECGEKRDGE